MTGPLKLRAAGLALALLTMGAAPWLPPDSAPGVLNPAVTPDTIHQTICKPGWSRSVRPSVSVTNKRKHAAMKAVGATNDRDWQWDHSLGIDLGGDPRDIRNQWLEPAKGKCSAITKDRLDRRLPKLICAGKVDLREAQADVVRNWVDAYNKYHIGPTLVCP